MKCLSPDMCRSWLAAFGLVFGQEELMLEAVGGKPSQPLMYVVIEGRKFALSEFCRDALDWLPAGRERLLVTSAWSNYPLDRRRIFETIRRGCGELDDLTAAPGHLFAATKNADTWYDDRPALDVDEEAIAMWLMALMLEWTWEGFVVVQGCHDVIFLGDGFVRFESADAGRMAEAESFLASWGLTSRTEFPWKSSAGSETP